MKPNYKFGLIGHKIGYSRSPGIFDAIYNYLGVDGTFENFDLAPHDLKAAFEDKTFMGVTGLAVTIPHKKTVIDLLDKIDPVAELLQAVNSIAFQKDGTYGRNTDWIGFAGPLASLKEQIESRSAMILGCGGGAKAALYSLYTIFGLRKFNVVVRNIAKAKESLSDLQAVLNDAEFDFVDNNSLPSAAIIVNCTPLGGWNYPDQSPLPEDLALNSSTIYYDLNYNVDNRTVARFHEQGITTIDGSAMLVDQALESFRAWTGDEVPFDPIYKAVFGKE